MAANEFTHILFSDGNGGEREYYAERLRSVSQHYLSHEAASDERGIAFVKSNHIDCVVVEIDLPTCQVLKWLGKLVPSGGGEEGTGLFERAKMSSDGIDLCDVRLTDC